MKCCICKEEIKGHGHNAEPLMKGRCCDDCNKLVITIRIADILKDKKVKSR